MVRAKNIERRHGDFILLATPVIFGPLLLYCRKNVPTSLVLFWQVLAMSLPFRLKADRLQKQ